jgi:hypothetical protein
MERLMAFIWINRLLKYKNISCAANRLTSGLSVNRIAESPEDEKEISGDLVCQINFLNF